MLKNRIIKLEKNIAKSKIDYFDSSTIDFIVENLTTTELFALTTMIESGEFKDVSIDFFKSSLLLNNLKLKINLFISKNTNTYPNSNNCFYHYLNVKQSIVK